ncbi:Kynurenine 3-monooxygenase [Gracilariopsis chorda]|uniref:Kynurenine 3-monooxygenase n=1 Tax=Gracilariopsis chorda TaxID=448386 RepID=A0A2V3IG44_9FLOR|nr:Kynurenine 3-monooxygenase [Gracilariopsis chorda]|eukprot:PXF41013.1 Kynurenine 3-monooxygenase [Gracilariopsis chorda]
MSSMDLGTDIVSRCYGPKKLTFQYRPFSKSSLLGTVPRQSRVLLHPAPDPPRSPSPSRDRSSSNARPTSPSDSLCPYLPPPPQPPALALRPPSALALRLPPRPNPLSSYRPPIAPSIINANPTIIGAGPIGCVLALLLQQHNIPVTLIDCSPRHLSFQAPRAYSFGINNRGQEVLSLLPALLQRFESIGARSSPLRRHFRQPDGSWRITTLGKLGSGKKPSISVLRHTFVSMCRDEVDAASTVTSMFDTTLDGIEVDADGQLQLQLKSASGRISSINTRLLLACDGVRSQCARLLQNVPVQSSRGLERQSVRTYAQNLQAKMLLLSPDFYKSEPNSNNDDQYAPGDCMMYTFHKIYPKRMEQSLLLDVFPQSQQVMKQQGGVRAAVRAHPSHVIWRLNDAKTAIDLFEKELPLLRPREVIGEEEMSSFLSVKPLNIPSVARRNSISATTQQGAEPSGIIFLGDSAHSFPPDVGEGLNAGLQDALVFLKTLLQGGVDDTPSQLASRYERVREPETSALMRFAQRSVIASVPSRLDAFNMTLRSVLANWFPGLFYAPAVFLRSVFDSYEEIMQRADQTTVRLYIAIGLLVVGISVPIVLLVAAM